MQDDSGKRSVRSARIGFWIRWIVATVVGLVVTILSGQIITQIGTQILFIVGFYAGFAIGIGVGASILGAAQKRVLLRYIAAVDGWTRVTFVGVLLGAATFFALVLLLPDGSISFVFACSLTGGIFGAAQAMVLRQKTTQAWLWLVPHMAAGFLIAVGTELGSFAGTILIPGGVVAYIAGTAFVMDRFLAKNEFY